MAAQVLAVRGAVGAARPAAEAVAARFASARPAAVAAVLAARAALGFVREVSPGACVS